MTGVATDTINDHVISRNQVWNSIEVGKRFHEPIMTMTTDGYMGSIPLLVTNLKLNIMSKKIIKVDENVDFSVFTKFTKDLGLFQVTARVWSMVSQDCTCSHDISEIELNFSVNNKPCNYNGFKELYEKLYGADTFNEFRDDLSKEFEEAYFKHTPYKTK